MPGRKQKFYQVAKVVDHRETGKGGVEYKVHWANYPSSEDTWEPEANLKYCQEYIQEYIMSSFGSLKPRRSARLAPSGSTSMFSEEEFEEEVVTELPSSPRRTRSRQTRQTRTKPVAEKPKPKPRERRPKDSPPSLPPPVTRTITLRSSTITLSSDEEDRVPTRSSPRSVERRTTTATELSETRFRKRINDIGKKRVVSSTPFSEASSTKVKLDFNRSFPKKTVRNEVRRYKKKSPVPEDHTVEEEEEDVVEEEEEIVEEDDGVNAPSGRSVQQHTFVEEEETWIGEADSEEVMARTYIPRPSLVDIGWKELTLAFFVIGLGAVGYICHTTDVCNMC